jgi:putative ABC transport system permease protein
MAIRVALGATHRELVTVAANHAGRLVGAGITLGVLTAAAATRLLQSLLFGVSATDPTSFAAAVLVFVAVAALATYLPARRLAHADPLSALRSE